MDCDGGQKKLVVSRCHTEKPCKHCLKTLVLTDLVFHMLMNNIECYTIIAFRHFRLAELKL